MEIKIFMAMETALLIFFAVKWYRARKLLDFMYCEFEDEIEKKYAELEEADKK